MPYGRPAVPEPGADTGLAVCARHPDRPTGLRCTRCGRPACPDCLREAAVGAQCVDCVREGRKATRRPVTIAGAELASRPIVVPALIAVNVLIYVLTAVQAHSVGGNTASGLFESWAMVPLWVAGGEWWRLVTAGFLHIGPIHLAMNMVALWVIGKDLELLLGRLRFGAIYAISLVGGNVAVYLLGAPNGPVAGASTAVFGLIGGVAVAVVRLKLNLAPVLGVIAINVFISFTVPGISLLGHLGGLVVGSACMIGMLYPPAPSRTRWQLGTVVGLVVLLAAAVLVRTPALLALT